MEKSTCTKITAKALRETQIWLLDASNSFVLESISVSGK
jgi:hypothetical protein